MRDVIDLGLSTPRVGISTRPNRKPSGTLGICSPEGVIQIPRKRGGFTKELQGVQPPLGFHVVDPLGQAFPCHFGLATTGHFRPRQCAFKIQPRQGQRRSLNVPTLGRPRSVQRRSVQFHWEFQGGKVASDEGPLQGVEIDALGVACQSRAGTLAHRQFRVVGTANANFCPIQLMKVDPPEFACPKGFPIECRGHVVVATFI